MFGFFTARTQGSGECISSVNKSIDLDDNLKQQNFIHFFNISFISASTVGLRMAKTVLEKPVADNQCLWHNCIW